MKKTNKNLSKRLLASVLAVAMCMGTATTAFAAEDAQDYVYVYVNVAPDTAETGGVTEAPTFEKFTEDNKDLVDQTKNAITTAESTVSNAEEKVTTAETDVTNAKVEEEKPEFDKDGELTSAVKTGKEQVGAALTDLENSKPTFSENDGTGGEPVNPLPGDDAQNTDETNEGETQEPSFVEEVTDRINALDKAKEETEAKVEAAKPDISQVKEELENLNNAAVTAKNELLSAQEAAAKAAEAANQAAKAAQKACDAEKEKLQAELDEELAQLTKPSETAPVRDSYETQEAYEAAYDTWKTEAEDYNKKVEEFKGAYDEKVSALDNAVKAEQDKLTAAETALEVAKKNLEELEKAFDTANGKYTEIAGTSDLIQKYNEALKAYNEAVKGVEDVKGYNDKVGDYNTAANAYNTAVENYIDAAETHNKNAKEYNDKLTDYNTKVDTYKETVESYESAVTTYETKVDEYNAKVVNAYNDEAAAHNTEQVVKADDINSTNEVADKLQNALKDLNTDIKITNADGSEKTVKSDVSAWSALSDEEYNQAVSAYNKKVDAYNAVIKTYNEKSVEALIAEVDKYFVGQGTHTDNKESPWYTVGKINVSGIFAKDPIEILDENLDKTKEDYNAGENPGTNEYGNYQGDSQNSLKYQGRDIYYFDKGGNVTDGNSLKKDEESSLFQNGKSVDTLKEALDKENLDRFKSETPNEESKFNPAEDINKWVLKVSYGANGYNGGNNDDGSVNAKQKETFHLDGYLYVSQLSQLAKLAERTVAKVTTEQVKAEYDTKVQESLDSKYTEEKKSFAEFVTNLLGKDDMLTVSAPTTYTPAEEVGTPNVQEVVKPDEWKAPDSVNFTPGELVNNAAPITITEPTTEEEEELPDDDDDEIIPDDDDDEIIPDDDDDEITIEDEIVPLAETPAEEAVIDIPEAEVPLAETPLEDQLIDIFDGDVPLADAQNTGDFSAIWYVMTLICGSALILLRKKQNS